MYCGDRGETEHEWIWDVNTQQINLIVYKTKKWINEYKIVSASIWMV